MNKELHTIEINKEIKELNVSEEKVDIVLNDETINIGTYHSQDCCENVYGDFSALKYIAQELNGKVIKQLVIKEVSGMGFLVVLTMNYRDDKKVFVPCYNYQNGYYSSNLALSIKRGEIETKIDISGLVEDHID